MTKILQELVTILQDTEDSLKNVTLIKYLTDYSYAGVTPREKFADNVMRALLAITAHAYNPSGSFTDTDAQDFANKIDVNISVSNDGLSFDLSFGGRLEAIELGIEDFSWFAEGDRWKAWRRALMRIDKALASELDGQIKRGEHKGGIPSRPYVKMSMREEADLLHERIDDMLKERFTKV